MELLSVTTMYIAIGSFGGVAVGGTLIENHKARKGDIAGAETVKALTSFTLTTIIFGSLFYFIAVDFPLLSWIMQ